MIKKIMSASSNLGEDPIHIAVPDFSLKTPEDFLANRSGTRVLPDKLIMNLKDKLPYQPPFPTKHPALRFFRDEHSRMLQSHPSEFLMTDAVFHRLSKENAIKKDILQKWIMRRLREKRDLGEFSEEIIRKELEHLAERFKVSAEKSAELTRGFSKTRAKASHVTETFLDDTIQGIEERNKRWDLIDLKVINREKLLQFFHETKIEEGYMTQGLLKSHLNIK